MTELRVAWCKVAVVIVIACASVTAQVSGTRGVRTWVPCAAAAGVLATALCWRSGIGRMGPTTFAALIWGYFGAVSTVASAAMKAGFEAVDAIRFAPALVAVALAEEIIFREDLPSALERLSWLARRPLGQRELTIIGISQGAFAVTHVPTLTLRAWAFSDPWLTLTMSVAGALAFGCLMAALRRVGAATVSRMLCHTLANAVLIAVPMPPALQVTGLLLVTLAGLVGFVGLGRLATPATSQRDLPSTPSLGPGTAPPAGHR